MTDAPGLEERVAALEECIRFPLRAVIPSWTPLTEAEEAEVRESITEAAKPGPYRVLPPEPPLTPEQVRYLLSECVTVVKPGETLIVRVPLTWTQTQVSDYAKTVSEVSEALEVPFRTLVVPGDQLAVAEAQGTPGAA